MIENAIIRELKKQVPKTVKGFDWTDFIQEWISEIVQEAINSPSVRKPVVMAVAAAMAKDAELLSKLVKEGLKKARS